MERAVIFPRSIEKLALAVAGARAACCRARGDSRGDPRGEPVTESPSQCCTPEEGWFSRAPRASQWVHQGRQVIVLIVCYGAVCL